MHVNLAIFAVLAIGLVMFGVRFGLWESVVGFGRTYMTPIARAVGIGLVAPTIYGQIQPPVRFSPIQDISIDTSNPPTFMVLDDNRVGAKNALVVGDWRVFQETVKNL